MSMPGGAKFGSCADESRITLVLASFEEQERGGMEGLPIETLSIRGVQISGRTH